MATTDPGRTPKEPTHISTSSDVRVIDARRSGEVLSEWAQAAGRSGKPFLTATVTSPPYHDLVDYGADGQIGCGENYDAYMESMRGVFETVWQWTLPEGVLWLIADSFLEPTDVAKMPSRLVPLPFELARLAESVGWQLREVVIWRKDRSLPWTHKGRLRNAFEHILLLVKSDSYKYRVDRLRELEERKGWWVRYPERYHPGGIAPENVWESALPLQGTWASRHIAHACPLPTDLVERMILLTTDPGDHVFDPFAGVGTVPAVAEALSRHGYGTELNPDYATMLESETRPRVRREVEARSDLNAGASSTLIKLRILKYPRELWRQIARDAPSVARPAFIWVNAAVPVITPNQSTGTFATVAVALVGAADASEVDLKAIQESAERVAKRAPLSKYRLQVKIDVVAASDFEFDDSLTHSIYVAGDTTRAAATLDDAEVSVLEAQYSDATTPPIVSPIRVNVLAEDY